MNESTINRQPKEDSVYYFGSLDIISIFLTIQGEGPFVGEPSIFIRMAGCSHHCPLCDTQYTQGRVVVSFVSIMEQIQQLSRTGTELIVLTGGEPLRQTFTGQAIAEFLHLCPTRRIQVETNGISYAHLPTNEERLSVVCSPKGPAINPHLAPFITALKYVVRAGEISPLDGLPLRTMGQGTPVARWNFPGQIGAKPPPIYIQPLDEQDEDKNKLNIKAAVESCMQFGHRLSLQVHKYLDMP